MNGLRLNIAQSYLTVKIVTRNILRLAIDLNFNILVQSIVDRQLHWSGLLVWQAQISDIEVQRRTLSSSQRIGVNNIDFRNYLCHGEDEPRIISIAYAFKNWGILNEEILRKNIIWAKHRWNSIDIALA